MKRNLFRYILAHSFRQQLMLLVLTAAALPFYYASLDIPKQIINKALGTEPAGFPADFALFGVSWGAFEQLDLLFVLCGVFLALVLVNGAWKYVINLYKGLLGERMIRRLRQELHSLILRFPLRQFDNVSEGELVSIISAEVEPVGGFIGDAVALPLYQGGLLATALMFIFVQDPIMGIAAVAFIPVQAAIIPRLQTQVNRLNRLRIQEVRRLSDDVAQAISMAREIRVNDTSGREEAEFWGRLSVIFSIRYDIYQKKFFIKFLNNFLAQLTPFLFFSIGGYLVIIGDLSLGELIAILAAYKDLAPPWKELLDYYQQQQDARIKFEQIVIRFDVPGTYPEAVATVTEMPSGNGLSIDQVLVSDESGIRLHDISVTIPFAAHTAIIGPLGSGKSAMAELVAGLAKPSDGWFHIGEQSYRELPADLYGRHFAYVDNEPEFFAGSIMNNLLYASRHQPTIGEGSDARGRSEFGYGKDLIGTEDGTAAKLSDQTRASMVDTLMTAGLGEDLLEFGLRSFIDVERHPEFARRIIEARATLGSRLRRLVANPLVEPLDSDRYNSNASLGENLLFGEPIGDELEHQHMAENRYVRRILDESGLEEDLVLLGYDIAERAALHEFEPDGNLQGRSPIEPEEVPIYRSIIAKWPRAAIDRLGRRDRRKLESLPLSLISAHTNLIEIDDELQSRIVEARRAFSRQIPDRLRPAIAFFDLDQFNPAMTVRENFVFGKIVDIGGKAAAELNALLREVVESLDLSETLQMIGLDFPVGARANRLTMEQRQKLAVARALFKQPVLLIANDAISNIDPADQRDLVYRVRQACVGRGLLWALPDPELADDFDHVITMRDGQIGAADKHDDLLNPLQAAVGTGREPV